MITYPGKIEKLSLETRKLISCKISIEFAAHVRNIDMIAHVGKIVDLCIRHGLKYKVTTETTVFGYEYKILTIKGYMNLCDTETFIEDIDLNVSIYYTKGSFHALYSNR